MTQNYKQPLLIMPCGPSGSGKSSLYNKLKASNQDLAHYSWDALRLNWYSSNYSEAFALSCKDKKFKTKVQEVFDRLIEQHLDIYVDNINNTSKSRAKFIQLAKDNGYRTIGYIFGVDLPTLLERRTSRLDKTLPEEAVIRQFKEYEGPLMNEFDEVRHANSA